VPYPRPVADVPAAVADAVEATGFSGVVRVDESGAPSVLLARGDADRAHRVPNGVDTRFAIASGTKSFTALVVVSLAVDGILLLATVARSLLGHDLPLIGDDVTVEHLLAHRSGIGDYLDEAALASANDYVMPVPVHRLDSTEAYLAVLDGHPSTAVPDAGFTYCNSGYVVLALLAERAAGVPFAELVRRRVAEPAGLVATGFLRSDELPGDADVGYLDAEGTGRDRTNVLHLPVVGSGDGVIYSTVADVHRLWAALDAGRVVPPEEYAAMTRVRSEDTGQAGRYGLGFWLPPGGAVALEGSDAGVSFRSEHDRAAGVKWTVVSNTTDGAWPVARAVAAAVRGR